MQGLGETVDDWMTKGIVSLSGNHSAYDAAKIMREQRIGSILIKENDTGFFVKKEGALLGIVTDTDLIFKVVSKDLKPSDVKLSSIMTPKPYTLESHSSLIHASNIMTMRRIKRIPITKKGGLAGILTITDLMNSLVKLGKIYEVGELVKYIAKKKVGTKKFEVVVRAEQWMSKDVVTCKKSDASNNVAELMATYKVGDAVVIEEGNMVGIVTDTDIVRKLCAENRKGSEGKISELMSSPVKTTGPETTLIEIANIMTEQRIKRIVIADKNKLKGILSVTDLADALTQLNYFAHAHKIIDMLYEK
jgi:CBS domain-containing protein